MPSRYHEFSPYSALEAMAQGVPVVATAMGGLPELVGARPLRRAGRPDAASPRAWRRSGPTRARARPRARSCSPARGSATARRATCAGCWTSTPSSEAPAAPPRHGPAAAGGRGQRLQARATGSSGRPATVSARSRGAAAHVALERVEGEAGRHPGPGEQRHPHRRRVVLPDHVRAFAPARSPDRSSSAPSPAGVRCTRWRGASQCSQPSPPIARLQRGRVGHADQHEPAGPQPPAHALQRGRPGRRGARARATAPRRRGPSRRDPRSNRAHRQPCRLRRGRAARRRLDARGA